MKKIEIILSAAVVILASCAKENAVENTPANPGSFTFSISSPETFKTELDGTAINFLEGDEIKVVWDGGESTGTVASGESGLELSVDIVPGKAAYYAVYPATCAAVLEGDELTVTTPSITDGSFAQASVMAAKTTLEDKKFAFKNICGYLKFTLGDGAFTSTMTRIIVRTGSNSMVSVNQPVTFDNAGEVTLGTPTNNIAYSAANVSGAGTYYIPVVADQDFSAAGEDCWNGIVIGFNASNSDKCHPGLKATKLLTVERGEVIDLGDPNNLIKRNVFIAPTAQGKGDGSSWENAASIDIINQMLDIKKTSHSYFVRGKVFRLMEGTYTPKLFLSNATSVESLVNIIGGHPSTSTGTATDNDITLYPTIFTKAIGGSDDSTIKATGEGTRCFIKSINFADISNSGVGVASGVCATDDAYVVVQDCDFNNCVITGGHGAAFNVNGAKTFIVKTSTIRNCSSVGGAMIIRGGVNARLDDCTISDCTSSGTTNIGGAICLQGAETILKINRCTFERNTQTKSKSKAFLGGGAICVSAATLMCDACAFKDNGASDTNGYSVRGGAINLLPDSAAKAFFNACSFDGSFISCSGDAEPYGTAIANQGGNKCAMFNCSFRNNYATGETTKLYNNDLFMTGETICVNNTIVGQDTAAGQGVVRGAYNATNDAQHAVYFNNIVTGLANYTMLLKKGTYGSYGSNVTSALNQGGHTPFEGFPDYVNADVTVANLGLTWSDGVWAWDFPTWNDPAKFTAVTKADVMAKIKTQTTIGEEFDAWLNELEAYGKDGRGATRTDSPYWPGAYQN